MKILYDHQIFELQRYGGISRYFQELINHSEGLFDTEISGVFFNNEYLKSNLKPKRIYFQSIEKRNNKDSLKKIKNADYSVLHSTYYDTYYLRKIHKPFVVTIHDMIPEIFLRYFYNNVELIRNKRILMEKAAQIIAVSHHTRNDILRIYPEIPAEKITVIHHGQSFAVSESITEKKNYILYVGVRRFYKNFVRFIKAVSDILLKYDLHLICTGSPFDEDETALIEKFNIKNRVESKFVSEEELKKLYEEALCFVFPSLYEGFGIPVLEAFSQNCPCLLSSASCFPEIGENAAEYFDPNSIDSMRNAIEKVIHSESLQKDMIAKGKEVLKKYSWRKSAEQHSEVYKSII